MQTLYLTKGIKSSRIKELMRQIIESPEKELTLYIDSTGGDIEAAHFFHGFLTTCGKTVITCVLGQCCSAAVIIAAAGEERWAVPTAQFMIHEPFERELPNEILAFVNDSDDHVVSILAKDFDEIIKAAQVAKGKIQAIVSQYYKLISEHSNLSVNRIRKEVAEAVDNDWCFTAKEALKCGLIENIGTPNGAAAAEAAAEP